jgi:DNA adenine methylase
MSAAEDTTALVGGPLWRYGGKGRNAHRLVPHFARARLYAEPFFGAGGLFFKVPPGAYERETVNDLDRSLTTFFRVLRDRTDELVRACELTPYSRDEFVAALEPAADELEEARRVWVRSRQSFAGKARTPGDWARSSGRTSGEWAPGTAANKLDALRSYAARLRGVAIDNVDAVKFVRHWARPHTFFICDPPYVPEARTLNNDYEHEMSADDHRRLAAALQEAVGAGARVALCGYRSALYDELFAGWRRVEFDVALFGTRHDGGQRRTEVLWMSYPASEELQHVPQLALFGAGGA